MPGMVGIDYTAVTEAISSAGQTRKDSQVKVHGWTSEVFSGKELRKRKTDRGTPDRKEVRRNLSILLALILRNLHWSHARFAIAPEDFFRDSVRMAPVIADVAAAPESGGFMVACPPNY